MKTDDAKRLLDIFQAVQDFTEHMPPLPEGVTPAYLKLLGAIQDLSLSLPEVRVSDLADRLHLALPGITRALKAMETSGLIIKGQSLDDKRVYHVKLTDKGRDIYQTFIKNYHQGIQKRLERLSLSQVHETLDMLEIILTTLKGGQDDK